MASFRNSLGGFTLLVAGCAAAEAQAPSASSEACGPCHEEELREWRGSGHQRAFDNALFRVEHEQRPSPWCTGCHAPSGELSAGVDCAGCHVRDGVVISARSSGRAPHRTRVDPEFDQPGGCASCHQFADQRSALLLQTTVDEWESSSGERTCVQCHMPLGSHSFPGGRDLTMRRRALAVSVEAIGGRNVTRVHVTLRPGEVGHAVPTGDIGRRLRVSAWPLEHLEATRSVELGRVVQQGSVVRDDRVGADGAAREVVIELPAAQPFARIGWSVDLFTGPFRAHDIERLRGEPLLFRMAEGTAEVSPGAQ